MTVYVSFIKGQDERRTTETSGLSLTSSFAQDTPAIPPPITRKGSTSTPFTVRCLSTLPLPLFVRGGRGEREVEHDEEEEEGADDECPCANDECILEPCWQESPKFFRNYHVKFKELDEEIVQHRLTADDESLSGVDLYPL